MTEELTLVLFVKFLFVIYEVVQITYIYLGGSPLTVAHFWRGAVDVAATGLLCLILQFPVRRLLFGHQRRNPVLSPAPVVFTKS